VRAARAAAFIWDPQSGGLEWHGGAGPGTYAAWLETLAADERRRVDAELRRALADRRPATLAVGRAQLLVEIGGTPPRLFALVAGERDDDRAASGPAGGLTIARMLVGRGRPLASGLTEPVLPMLRAQGTPVPATRPLPAPTLGPPRRILVVDRDRDAADAMAALLERQGHEAFVVHDGSAILEAARGFGPEIVLLDLGLAGVDGHEVARRLRAEPTLRAVLLVAVTGHGQPIDAPAAGFDRHLERPLRYDELAPLLAMVRAPTPS
jgi:CheY-like chemotaxis protein